MNMISRPRFFTLILYFVFSVAYGVSSVAQENPHDGTQFANSGSAAAQQDFLDGLLMLHSFQYEDANESFLKAQQIDSDFAMAYWGEAMTYNHPLWFDEIEIDKARAALTRLGGTPQEQLAKAPTEREKGYLAAVQKLFGSGDRQARDIAYLEAMQQLAADYPDDLDAAAFLSLALLGSKQGVRDVGVYMQAAAIAEEVFGKNPQHSGAAHYLIHSYDDPIHAPLGLRAARVYADLAPSASHAQHMPSHIFYALGMWDEANQSNIDAYVSDRNRSVEREIALSTHGYHAIWWLLYGQLQIGQVDEARSTLEMTESHFASEQSTALSHDIVVFMNAHYAIESQTWNHVFNTDGVNWGNLEGRSLAAYSYVKGVQALENGNITGAKQVLTHLQDQLRNDSDVGDKITQLELQALIQLKEGDIQSALTSLNCATELEESMPLYFGPPWPIKPSHELYGEVLLDLGQPALANEQFAEGLARLPGRALSLAGVAAAEAAN